MRRGLASRPVLAALGGALAVACLVAILPAPATAGPRGCKLSGLTPGQAFHRVELGKSYGSTKAFTYNFDFSNPTCSAGTNVEWPIDLIFYGNATRYKVEHELGRFFPYCNWPFTTTEWALMDDGAGDFWAKDNGCKDHEWSRGTTDEHYRIYAYSEREYVMGLGYVVIGSMHKDNNECAHLCAATWGESEQAEKILWADVSSSALEWKAYYDNFNMQNEVYGGIGNHYWENDGKATMIEVP